jgi:hypothetical protein
MNTHTSIGKHPTVDDIFHNILIRQRFLPYCFLKMYNDDEVSAPSKHFDLGPQTQFPYKYLPLNRYYKPLGVMNGRWVKYVDYPEHIINSRKPFSKMTNMWSYYCTDSTNQTLYFIYTGGTENFLSEYGKRLGRLMKYIQTTRIG